jgi:hypothetical protein
MLRSQGMAKQQHVAHQALCALQAAAYIVYVQLYTNRASDTASCLTAEHNATAVVIS